MAQGGQRAKRGVIRLTVPHIYVTIHKGFIAPLTAAYGFSQLLNQMELLQRTILNSDLNEKRGCTHALVFQNCCHHVIRIENRFSV